MCFTRMPCTIDGMCFTRMPCTQAPHQTIIVATLPPAPALKSSMAGSPDWQFTIYSRTRSRTQAWQSIPDEPGKPLPAKRTWEQIMDSLADDCTGFINQFNIISVPDESVRTAPDTSGGIWTRTRSRTLRDRVPRTVPSCRDWPMPIKRQRLATSSLSLRVSGNSGDAPDYNASTSSDY